MKTIRLAALASVFVVYVFVGISRLPAATPAEKVGAALDSLRAWLATDSRGAPVWNEYLRSEELASELAKGAEADGQVIRNILERYRGQVAGLDRPRFVAVRQALEAWSAELSHLKIEDLPGAARKAAESFVPLDPQRVPRAKARVGAALAELDRWLVKSGASTNAGWKQYLGWNDTLIQLEDGAMPDAKVLESAVAKLRANETGLELARFSAAREALQAYLLALEFSSAEQLKEESPKRLEELAARLEALQKTSSGEDLAELGRLAGWLANAGQAPEVVAGVRRNFSRPNLYAHVSAPLIDAAAAEDVNDTAAVNEMILKAHVVGTAYTRGRIGTNLLPASGHAALEIILSGNTYSDNVGYQGPVAIFSEGYTNIYARKRLLIDDRGIRGEPAEASCATSTSINQISAPLRIIERLAWKKAGKSQGAAEQVASSKAEARVAAQMDRRVSELIDKANSTYSDKFQKPLVRRGEFPRHISIRSTETELALHVRQVNEMQLAAPGAPPDLSGGQDMSVRIHESLVTNFAESAIGGETLTDERLAKMLQDATGSVPEELQLSPDKDPWSITFHAVRPVSAQFSGQEIKLAVRGQRFTRGENAIKEPMEISAAYKIERTGNGVKFVRQGDVGVEYIDKPARLSVTQVTFKTFMRRKFGALFKEEIDRGQDGLTLPGRLEKVGPLPLDVMSADEGWLVAAWKLPPKTLTARAANR